MISSEDIVIGTSPLSGGETARTIRRQVKTPGIVMRAAILYLDLMGFMGYKKLPPVKVNGGHNPIKRMVK